MAGEEMRLRDDHAKLMIARAEEQARAYKELQARVDAEEHRRRADSDAERARLEAIEAERAQQRYAIGPHPHLMGPQLTSYDDVAGTRRS